ncbi:MAG: DUF885 domain-containing protein [Acidobacteriota bacterium]|nr:DUF885 domain-containing protein [Acidobacteriota bacterium]
MTRRSGLMRLVAVLLVIIAGPAQGAPDTSVDPLTTLVEAYYDEFLKLNPAVATYNGDHRFDDQLTVGIAAEHRKASLALERTYLKKIEALDGEQLSDGQRLTRALFLRERRLSIEDAVFPDHLIPIDQIASFPVQLATLGSGKSIQPFATVKDYDNWLARLAVVPDWVETAIGNMRTGIERGVVQPRIVIERAIPIMETHVVDDPTDSVFYRPVRELPANTRAKERKRIEQAYRKVISDVVVPGYQRLATFLREEYLPSCRPNQGLGRLPGGREWYAHLVRAHTTTSLTPQEIHELGRKEVDRIIEQLEVERRRDWKDSAPEWDGPLLDGYRELTSHVMGRLPQLFHDIPDATFEVRPVESFRSASAPGASYVAASPDGDRPGVFYVNASEKTTGPPSDALFLHEAIPGHHLQISLQRELAKLPRFRRFGHQTAFSEGWALYAERLGTPLGLYRNRNQTVRALYSELFRARRLVVDTGLHAMSWNRKMAIKYISNEREVDRYLAMPGQALAYKVGQLHILELRRRAEERLGEQFDVRDFHRVILGAGALPLDILENRVEAWIEASLANADKPE